MSRLIAGISVVVVLLAVACGSAATSAPAAGPVPTATTAPAATTIPSSIISPTDTPEPTETEVPAATAEPVVAPEATSAPVPTSTATSAPTPAQETAATLEPIPTDVPATEEPQLEEVTRTVKLKPSKDNTLYQASSNFTSNGSGQHLFVEITNRGSARRALLAFDVSDAIPEGATVNNVALTLNMSKTVADVQEIELHRLLSDWGEGTSDAGGNEGVMLSPTP